MEIFLSAEIDVSVYDQYKEIEKEIKSKIKLLEKNNYGKGLVHFGFIPIIVKQELLDHGFFQEIIKYSKRKKDADIRLRIDIDEFKNSTVFRRKILVAQKLIDAVSILEEKSIKDFDALQFKKDIVSVLELQVEIKINLS